MRYGNPVGCYLYDSTRIQATIMSWVSAVDTFVVWRFSHISIFSLFITVSKHQNKQQVMLQRFDQPLQWTPAISNMLYLKQKSRYFQNLRNLVPRASFHAMIDLSWRVIPVYQKTKRGPGNEVANYDFTPCKNSCYLEYALSRIVCYLKPYFQCITYWSII